MRAKTRRKHAQREAAVKRKQDEGKKWQEFWLNMEHYLDWKLKQRAARDHDLCICEHARAEHDKQVAEKDFGSCALCECTGFIDRSGDGPGYTLPAYDPEEALKAMEEVH